MKRIPTPQNSLTAKMVLAFVLVAVPPLLISGYMIVWLVNKSVNHNLEKWLQAGRNYIFSVVDDTRKQIATVQKLEAPDFKREPISFAPAELEAMYDLGVDFIVLTDEQGRVSYAAPDAVAINPEPIFHGSDFYFAHYADSGEPFLAIVERTFVTDSSGAVNELIMGAEFEIDIVVDEVDSMELRIFIPSPDGFTEIYASRPEIPFDLPEEALKAIEQGAEQFFISGESWTDYDPQSYRLLTIYRNPQGGVEGVVVISAVMSYFHEWYMNPLVFFWIFVVIGTTLSCLTGYIFARRLVRPIKQLSKGAKYVAQGNFNYSVPVRGKDEVAALAANFNIMANQLEMAKHRFIETNRQERARMLGEIAIGFAHEIRNPLVIIKTSAEVVCGKLPKTEKEYRILGFVVQEVERIDALLTEFLTFARPAPVKFEYFELRPLVASILEMSAAEFERRGIKWQFTDEVSVQAPKGQNKVNDTKIIGEYSKIRQVLLNLILNAMDAMPDGGALTVRLYPADDGKMLMLDIQDSGQGIPAEIQDSIHLPFNSTKSSGQGLGLSVAYAIIEAHDGRIFFTSSVGKGTTFTVGLRR